MSDNALEHLERAKPSATEQARERAERNQVAAKRADLAEGKSLRAREGDAGAQEGERARKHPEKKALHSPAYYKRRGNVGEALVSEELKADNLNSMVKCNFANYDIVSRGELTSVKVRGQVALGLRSQEINNYVYDFKQVVNPDSSRNLVAGNDLFAASVADAELWKELSLHLPRGFARQIDSGGTPNLAAKGVLRIPVDHVGPVGDQVRKRIMAAPHQFGIWEELSNEQLEQRADQMVERHLKPIDHLTLMDLHKRTIAPSAFRK